VDDCALASEQVNRLLDALINSIRKANSVIISKVEVKESISTGKMLLVLYTNSEKAISGLKKLTAPLESEFELAGITAIVETKETLQEHTLYGQNIIEEKINDKKFLIGSRAFSQVNIPLFSLVVDRIRIISDPRRRRKSWTRTAA